jgi:membrane protease YdiL (CAAX protease family)
MKSFGIAATLGLAFTALMFGWLTGIAAAWSAAGGDIVRASRDGAAMAASLMVGNSVQVVTLALAARMTGEDLFAYLGLDVPRRRDLIVTAAMLVVLIALGDLATLASGHDLVDAFQLDVFRSAPTGALLPLWIGIIVAAPAGEELLFRGFLFRGFIHEPRNAVPGILAISLIFAVLHFQYDLFGKSLIFTLGVFLGFVRLWTGSTTLTIALHMLVNLESVVETLLVLGWL